MTYRLRSYEAPLPGNYPYEQTEGIHRRFAAQPIIEAQAQIVSTFRKANGLPRASIGECLQDVDSYQCQRLGNHPTWCTSCDPNSPRPVAMLPSNPNIAPPCAGCGAPIQ